MNICKIYKNKEWEAINRIIENRMIWEEPCDTSHAAAIKHKTQVKQTDTNLIGLALQGKYYRNKRTSDVHYTSCLHCRLPPSVILKFCTWVPDSARWPPWLHGYYAESTVFNRFLKFFFHLGNSNDFQRCSTYLQCRHRSWWNPNGCRRKHPLAMVYQNVSSQMENTLFAFHYHEWPRRYGNPWFSKTKSKWPRSRKCQKMFQQGKQCF